MAQSAESDNKIMSNKYQYEAPKNTREQIESVAWEMRFSPSAKRSYASPGSMKDLLAELVSLVRSANHTREYESERIKNYETAALTLFAVFCLLLTYFGRFTSSDLEWVNDGLFFAQTLGVGTAAVYVGIAIERTALVEVIWRYNITKFLASILLSTLVVYSAGRASSIINDVFGIDASAFPYTRALLAGWIAFVQIAKPILLLVCFCLVAHCWNLASWFKSLAWPSDRDASRSDFPWQSLWFAILSTIVLLSAFDWIYRSLEEAQLPTKVYQMARTLDFNSRHACSNLPDGVNVIFIGPEQSKVLIDGGTKATLSFKDFIGRPASEWERPPRHFSVSACAVGSSLLLRP